LYKYLNKDGTCRYGGPEHRWPLPVRNDDGTWTPGEWMPPLVGPLSIHDNAYHAFRVRHHTLWSGPALYAVEYRGERIDFNAQVLLREARLLRPVTVDELREAFLADYQGIVAAREADLRARRQRHTRRRPLALRPRVRPAAGGGDGC
jgi:hypothetical protein